MCITANLVSKRYQSFGYYDSTVVSYHDWYVSHNLTLFLASQGYDMVPFSLYTIEGVNCVSLLFGSFMSIYTSVGKVVSLNNLGGYLSIAAIWRYGVLYGTDGTYHDWYGIYNLVLSLCKSGVGTLSLYTIRGVNCVSLQFGSYMSIFYDTQFRVPKK